MRRPGFTILELVIALGLVVLLFALAMPALYERLGDSRLDSAGRDVAAVVAAVRADAMREGRSLAVRAERDGERVRIVSTPLEPAGAAVTMRVALPEGVEVRETPQIMGGAGGTDGAVPVAAIKTEEVEKADPGVVLGVLLPDGSAWSSGVTYLALLNAPARVLEVKLNSWTGATTVTEMPLAATAKPEEEPTP